ncbi:MAG: hypothetical protein KY442_13695, partial [Proteobacteria bacterium]|nr:hypothetical protein [Pseudomonadota bacterium]
MATGAGSAGRPALPVPSPAVSLVARAFRGAGLVDFSPEQMRYLEHGRVADVSRLQTEFGWAPRPTAQAFDDFVATVDPAGFLVACADDPGARALAQLARDKGIDVRTYGTAADADLRLDQVTVSGTTSRYQPVLRGRRLPPVTLAVPGRHLALNSGAALLTAIGLGLPEALLVEGLGGFYLVEAPDLDVLVEGMRLTLDIASRTPLRRHSGDRWLPAPGADDDAALRAHVRSRAETIYHPTSTAAMGADESS